MKKVQSWKVFYLKGTDFYSRTFPSWKQARRFMKTVGAHYVKAVII